MIFWLKFVELSQLILLFKDQNWNIQSQMNELPDFAEKELHKKLLMYFLICWFFIIEYRLICSKAMGFVGINTREQWFQNKLLYYD